MQAKTRRNYHLHHPFHDSPAALPWPTDPPETVRKLADIMRSHAKAKMQTPAEPPLRDSGQQATHPFFKPHAPRAPPPPVPPERARRKRGAPAPNQAGKAATSRPPASHPTQPANRDQASSSSSLPPLPPPHLDQASSSSSLPPPALPRPRRTQDSKRARRSATTTRATGSGVGARSGTGYATRGTTRGH